MVKIRYALVMLESLAGTGHKIYRIKPRGGDKLSVLHKDPWVGETVLYRERMRMRTINYNRLPRKLQPVTGSTPQPSTVS